MMEKRLEKLLGKIEIMVKKILIVGYCVIIVFCFKRLEVKYGEIFSPTIWFTLSVASIILGRLSKRFERYLVNTYLFFGVIILVLITFIQPLTSASL
jgi:hypothetical protein